MKLILIFLFIYGQTGLANSVNEKECYENILGFLKMSENDSLGIDGRNESENCRASVISEFTDGRRQVRDLKFYIKLPDSSTFVQTRFRSNHPFVTQKIYKCEVKENSLNLENYFEITLIGSETYDLFNTTMTTDTEDGSLKVNLNQKRYKKDGSIIFNYQSSCTVKF